LSNDEQEMMKRYFEQLENEKYNELARNSKEIEKFSDFCRSFGVEILPNDFDYLQTTGLVAQQNSLLNRIFIELPKDKDGLFSWNSLRELLTKSEQMPGYIPTDNFVAMVHPYFRRGMHTVNNFSPRFIDLFWEVDDSQIDAYIALDSDRVRPTLDSRFYMEADTWFGAPFDENVENVPDGISKLRPPLDIESHINSFIFKDAYSLDIKWSTKGNIKTFQALEFKQSDIVIEMDGITYHPVRYIHAEYDLSNKCFRHFDGAVHHYLPHEYSHRRDMDFNVDNKSESAYKAVSVKLFKFNGSFSVDFWVNFSCHYLTGNPLVFEYFSGNYPNHVVDALERIRAKAT
jgi:hypothetical protein